MFRVGGKAFLCRRPISHTRGSHLVFYFVLLSLPKGLGSFLRRSRGVLSLFARLFAFPTSTPVGGFLSFSQGYVFRKKVSQVATKGVHAASVARLSKPGGAFRSVVAIYCSCNLYLRYKVAIFLCGIPMVIQEGFVKGSLSRPRLKRVGVSLVYFPFPNVGVCLNFHRRLGFRMVSKGGVLRHHRLVLRRVNRSRVVLSTFRAFCSLVNVYYMGLVVGVVTLVYFVVHCRSVHGPKTKVGTCARTTFYG